MSKITCVLLSTRERERQGGNENHVIQIKGKNEERGQGRKY